MVNLIPFDGCVLIELSETYEFAATPDKEFATKTSGHIRAIPSDEDKYTKIMNKRVWFKSYEDDIKIDEDGKTFTFVEYEKLRGYKGE
jgi:hypothetical protein